VATALLLFLLLALSGCGARHHAAVEPCRASQLRVTQGRTGVGLGNWLQELVFTNVGPRACLLRGHPTITTNGRPLDVVRGQGGGTYFGRLVPAVLRPGEHGFLDFGTATGTDCGGRPTRIAHYRDLVFTLPGGGRVRGTHVSITEHCSLSISALGRHERPG
jgi:hypothetical protein